MTAQAFSRFGQCRKSLGLWLPLALSATLIAGAGTVVSYVLWPTWPRAQVPDGGPAIPVAVAGVLFNVPRAAIRAAVLRNPGAHERIDLVFLWPSLMPPQADGKAAAQPAAADKRDSVPIPSAADRLFVTIAGLGMLMTPAERLRTVYPRYFEAQATAGADGLAILAFRAGTPYDGEDLVYVAKNPEQFFARCTRPLGAVPGTCMHERSLDVADMTFRFPREWLQDWRSVSASFDRLIASLHR